jgi:hypothetical protein
MLRIREGIRIGPWADLSASDKTAIQRMTGRQSVPALIMPQPGRGTIKAIDGNAASLLNSLTLSAEVCNSQRIEDLSSDVKSLILDDILEVETSHGFVSGPAAAPFLSAMPSTSERTDPISRISRDALQYAASLPVDDARALSSRLYRYNSVPCSSELQSAFGNNSQIAGMLGLTGSSSLIRCLSDAGYERVNHVHWHAWTRRRFLEPESLNSLRYKLYISPAPHVLFEVVERAMEIAVRLQIPSLKIGKSIANLLRPDKFIFYTDSIEALDLLAQELQPEIDEFPAQGVPFTQSLYTTGIISAGSDPPRSLCNSGWAQAESWRAWITDRLALALMQARDHTASRAAQCEFALSKLSVEGIDTRDWTATPQLWEGEPS